MKKIKIGAVSYLNTKPLLYGIQHYDALLQQVEIVEDYPANIAAMLLSNQVDAGLVPVSIIPGMREHYIISNFCIGAEGDVASVCLFSEVPIEAVTHVLLDYQSRTSVALCKILLKHFWKLQPVFCDTKNDFRKDIKGTTAGLVIGDRALEQRRISAYCYDLAGAWKSFTGLPFVFAAWVANKKLPKEFIDLFNAANAYGVQQIETVARENADALYDVPDYFSKHVSFELTEQKIAGFKKFLEFIKEDGL